MPGRLICFVCGSPGANGTLRTRQCEREPYFPFLIHHDPPKGARMATPDGVIDSCAVCYMFLLQQWDSYERSKTPAVKRLYWLKRSDNGSFTGAEMRIQGEYIAQVMGLQYPPGAEDRGSPDNLAPHIPEKEPPDHSNSSAAMYAHSFKDEAKYSKKADKSAAKTSVLDLSTSGSKKSATNYATSDFENHSRKVEERATCYICGDSYVHTVYNLINVLDQGQREPFFPMLERVQPFPGSEYMSRNGQVKGCNHCKNVLFEQWQAYEMTGTPVRLRNFKIARNTEQTDKQEIKTEKYASNENTSCYHCYICGNPYISDHVRLLNTLPPKRPSPASMFFPFVRELKRPSGAEPLRSDGTVIVCIKCFDHLSYQWEAQEREAVPMYHRQYTLQFLASKPSEPPPPMPPGPQETHSRSPPSEDEEEIEPLNIQVSLTSPSMQQNQSFQPGLLAIATDQDSRPVSRNSSLSCSPIKSCDIVTDSRLSSATEAQSCSSSKTVPHPLQQVTEIPNRICFLCAEKCLIHKMKHLNSYPARHEAKHTNTQIDPFFPNLANIKPAIGAEELSEEGTVIVCKLCFYSLLKQWTEYENSTIPSDSNRWLRNYNLPDYICYVCAGENERKKMRSIAVKNFNFLLDHKAPRGSLVIDEGLRVVVCKSCAYSLMKQFTEYDRMGVPHKLRKFNWNHKASFPVEGEEEMQQLGSGRERTTSGQGSKVIAAYDEDSHDESSMQGPLGSKPPSLNIMSPAGSKQARNTATVSPLHHVTSPTNGVNSMCGSASLNASRTSGFAAALRKLANQAKDPPDEPGSKTPVSNASPRNTVTTKSGPSGPPPLMYTSTTLTSPPVVTIAPTQSHPSILSSDTRPSLERLHSNSSMFESVAGKHDRPHSSASRDEERAASRDNHSQSNRRMTPHSTPGATSPMSAREESAARGFQPYRPGDDLRPPLSSSLVMDQAAAAAAAAYNYPAAAFLPPHAFPHPAFRFDDPLLMERYRMMQSPYLPYTQGMMPHPSLHHLLAAGARYPPEMFPPQFNAPLMPGRLPPEHRSPSIHSEREERARELERERDKERDKEKELSAQRERQKLLEREAEKQRECDRLAHRESRHSLDSSKDRAEHSISSKYGSIMQGSSKGLGIADRYPRVSSSVSSHSSSGKKDESRRPSRDDERRLSRDDQHSSSHGSRPSSSHKSSSDDHERRYSLVNPMKEGQGHKSRPPPLVSPRSHDEGQHSHSRSGKGHEPGIGLFRPFDSSSHVVNGYDSQRDRGEQQQHSGHKSDTYLNLSKHSEYRGIDKKFAHSKELEAHGGHVSASSSSGSSAFHTLSNHITKTEHDSLSRLHSVTKEMSSVAMATGASASVHQLPGYSSHSAAPLNVPAYRGALLQSNVASGRGEASVIGGAVGDSARTSGHDSRSCISKLDLDERRKSESRVEKSSCCSDSECDSETDEDGKEVKLLISSGPPLKLDTSPKKIKLFSELGLTTFSDKKDADFERWRKRRRRMKEPSVSPMSVEEDPPTPLKTRYAPEELCREPDFKNKCNFMLENLALEIVPADIRKEKQEIILAVEAEKKRRLYSVSGEGETPTTPGAVDRSSSIDRQQQSAGDANPAGAGVVPLPGPGSSANSSTSNIKDFSGLQSLQQMRGVSQVVSRETGSSRDSRESVGPRERETSNRGRDSRDGRDSVNRESVKRKLDEDYDDVFNFSTQESKSTIPGLQRQSSNTSTSSIGKLTPRTSFDHSDRIKSEPPNVVPGSSVIKTQRPNSLAKNFAHKFHESVLQSTRQKERQKEFLRVSGESGSRLSDLSPMSLSGLSPGSGLSPMSGHHMLPWRPDSMEAWPGLDVVMETYQKHTQGEKVERHVLIDRNRHLRTENSRLNMVAAQLSQRMEEMYRNQNQLAELRNYNQDRIDAIKSYIRKLK